MSTVKEVINGFLARVNLPQYASYVGSTAPAQLQYLALLEQVGDLLRNWPVDWPQLKRNATFTVVSGQKDFQLTGDHYRMLESTQWDLTNKWPLRGPISDFNYAVRAFAVMSLQTRKAYRVLGPINYIYNTSPWTQRSAGYIELDPVPTNSSDQMYYEYISCNWVWPKDWAATTAYVTGDLRSGNGQIYRCKASGTSGSTRPSGTAEISDGAVTWNPYTEPYTWTSDDDILLFDKDILIEGMKWAYRAAKDLEYAQMKLDWESMVRSATARFQPSIRTNAADEFGEFFEWPNVPPASWGV